MLEPWTPLERTFTALIYVAYVLTFIYVFPRIKAWRPHWEGRAEVASMVPGLAVFFVLNFLAVRIGI